MSVRATRKMMKSKATILKDKRNERTYIIMPQDFKATQTFGEFAAFDDKARLIKIISSETLVPYDDILEYSYLEEHGKMGRGGVARAFSFVLSGNYLATSMKVRLLIKGDPPTEEFISLMITPIKSTNFIYRSLKESADAIMSKLSEVCPLDLPVESQDPGYIDEIRQLSRLKDEGAITEEEFEQKKKQLLGL